LTSSIRTDEVEAGRIGRAHGLDGSFYVTRPLNDALAAETVRVGDVATAVVRRSGTAAKPILRLAAFSSRTEIEAVRGEPLWVPRETVELDEDEFWADDLVGLRVVDGEREVGVVAKVRELPSCEVLEVGDLLIPLVDDAVRTVDLEAGVVDVDLEFLGES
jgi:16S rRNA processing protein RimM